MNMGRDAGAAFTPGPWEVDGTHVYAPSGILSARRKVCIVRDNLEANARLISAAPELYEALRLFVEEYDAVDDHTGVSLMIAYDNALMAGRAALAKARGQQQ
jgi:hypothetical protein